MNNNIVARNEDALSKVVKLIKNVSDKLVNSEHGGILAKPDTASGIVQFSNSVSDILTNKLKDKLGV